MSLSDDELWVLSYYRGSEINGSLFFGRLARALRPGPVQHDMSRHFADEAQHAWYWTSCIDRLGARPLKLDEAYQDQYLEAAGIPANLMEVLAVTLVFERRVINQYAKHLAVPAAHPEVRATIGRIMEDERWHIRWVRTALADMKGRYGADDVDAAVQRYAAADREVYTRTLAEHEQRLAFMLGPRRDAEEPRT